MQQSYNTQGVESRQSDRKARKEFASNVRRTSAKLGDFDAAEVLKEAVPVDASLTRKATASAKMYYNDARGVISAQPLMVGAAVFFAFAGIAGLACGLNARSSARA